MKKENEESALVSAAKTLGGVVGKVAALAGSATDAVGITDTPAPAKTKTKKIKAGKLPPKNKQRLPRKEKKAAKKAELAKQKA